MGTKRLWKILAFLLIIIGAIYLLSSCGSKNVSEEVTGSEELEEMAYYFDEHLFSYMDRRVSGVNSPTGYLVAIDTTTSSVGGYVRNPYGGWTRDWGETAPIGKDIQPGIYRVDYKLDKFTIGEYEYLESTWFSKIPEVNETESEWNSTGLVFCTAATDLPKPVDRYRLGVYLSEDHGNWIFRNCQISTTVVVIESEYIAD